MLKLFLYNSCMEIYVIGNIFRVSFDLSIDIINVCKEIVAKSVYLIFCEQFKFICCQKKMESGFPAIRADSRRSTFQTRRDAISLSPRLYLSICTRRCVIISSSSFYFRKNPVHRVSIETDHFPRVEASTTSAQLTTDAST